MNTGFLGPAVTTVLTVYGIETYYNVRIWVSKVLQQYLPFTVLKLAYILVVMLLVVVSYNSTYRLRY